MKYKKLHIYTLASKVKILSYIFLIPIFIPIFIRSISIWELIFTYTLCILISTGIVFFYFHNYINSGICQNYDEIHLKSGIFTKKERIINLKNVCSVSIEQNILNKLTVSSKVFFTFYKMDFTLKNSIYLSKKQVNNIKNYFIQKISPCYSYKISIPKLILLSVSDRNTIYSLFVAIPIIRKINNLTTSNSALKHSIINKFKSLGINPIITLTAYMIISVSIVISVIQIFKFWNLSVKTFNELIYITHGSIFSALHIIKISDIHAISYKFNLLCLIFRAKLMYLHITKNKSSHSKIIVSIDQINQISKLNKYIITQKGNKIISVCPPKKSLFNYIAFPVYSQIFLLFIYLIPGESQIKNSIILATEILLISQLFIRLYSFKKSHVTLYENSLSISCFKGLSLFTGIIPNKNIKKFVIRQTPFQIFSKKCNLYIYPSSNTKENFRIKHLYIENVENLVETFENSQIYL